jgi:hypothetical protein
VPDHLQDAQKAVRQGRSERRGEEVRSALCVGRSRFQLILANGQIPPVIPISERLALYVEPLSDARPPLADFFSILLAGFTRVYDIDCKAWVIRLLATSIANMCMKSTRSTPTKNLATAALSSTFVTCRSSLI